MLQQIISTSISGDTGKKGICVEGSSCVGLDMFGSGERDLNGVEGYNFFFFFLVQ